MSRIMSDESERLSLPSGLRVVAATHARECIFRERRNLQLDAQLRKARVATQSAVTTSSTDVSLWQLIPISFIHNCVEIYVGGSKRVKILTQGKLFFIQSSPGSGCFFFPSCPGSGFSLLPRTKSRPQRLLRVCCLPPPPPPPPPLPFQCTKVTRGVNTRERVDNCYI